MVISSIISNYSSNSNEVVQSFENAPAEAHPQLFQPREFTPFPDDVVTLSHNALQVSEAQPVSDQSGGLTSFLP